MTRFFERDKRTGHRRPIDPETLGVGVEFSDNPDRPVRTTGGGVLGRIAQRNFDTAYSPREYPEASMDFEPVSQESAGGGGVLGGRRRRGGVRVPSMMVPEVPETQPAPKAETPAMPAAGGEEFKPWDGGGKGGRMPSLPGHEVWKAPEGEEKLGGGKAFGVGARAHTGSALGAVVGAAALGATVGSVIPVAGTAVGAALGAIGVGVATLAGALGGGWLGGKAQDKIEERMGVKDKWEKELSLARQQHPYATFSGEIGAELAGMAAGNWGAGALRAARGGKVALDAAKAAERLTAMAKEGKDVAAARQAIDAYRTAQQNAEAARKATRAARGAKKIAEEQAKLKAALAAVEATERAAQEAAAANGFSLVGERAAKALKAGRRLGNATVAGSRMAGEGSPSDYTMPEADTPCGRLLTESEAGEWARQENRILGGNGDEWWNGLAAGVRDPWRGREKLKRVPFLGHWLNAGIEREMEGRKRRLAENGYMRADGTFDWALKREDERKIVAQRNRDLVNAAKSKSIAYSAANLISTQPTFWAEMGMSPTVLKMPGFADVRGAGGVGKYALKAVVNGLAQAQFSPGGVVENYERNRARKWTIRQDAFDALDMTVEREGDGALRALWKAWVRNNNEYVSEHLGEVLNLAGLKVVNRALPQGLARKLTRLIDDTAEPTTFLHRLFRASGVQPAFEMAEERLNDMMNVALHADDNDEGKSFGRRMFEAAWPGPRQLVTEMLGFAAPAAAKLTAGAVLNRRWGEESGPTDGGKPVGGGEGGAEGGGVEAASSGGPRWTPTAEAFAGWRERITATLDAAGRTDAAERIRNAANPDDLMDALGNAIGQMLQDGFERMLTPDQRQALDGLQGEERLVAAAQLATSWNEMERGLLAAANILERGDLGDEAAQRTVDALCQLKPEWRDALRDGMEPHEALSAILLVATDEIRDGTLDLADSKWKDAGAAALAASVSDRENDAIGDITLDALVGALNATQREEYDSLGTAGEKVAYLDSMLRGLGGQNAGVFTVARHIAGLDDGANVPEKMLDATISQLQAQFPGHASAATGRTKREQLRALVRSIEADERNKEILRVFTEEGRLPDVADEGDFGAPIDELGGEEEAAAANPPAGEPPAPPAAGEALASQVPGMPVPDTSSLSPEGREALEAQARERLNEGARQDAAPPNAAPQNAAPREAESPEAARRRQALSRRQARKRKGGLKFRTDYDAMGADALRQECRKRGISPEGTEEELRALIEEDDIRATHGAILGKRFEADGALKTIAENAMKALKGIGVLKGIEFRDIYTADGGRAHGAFNQPSGILYLSRDCRTDTLAHEIRHVLWQATQVSTDAKMRKLHQAFRRIAESAPEAVKRLVVQREGEGLLDDENMFLNEVFAACGELSGAHDFLGALHSHAAARGWWGRVHAAAKRLVDGAIERFLPFLKTSPRYANVENALLALSEDILSGKEIDLGAMVQAAEREEKAEKETRRDAASPSTDEPAPILSGDEVRKGMPGYDPKNWRTHVDKTGYVGPRMEARFQELLRTRKGKGNGTVVFLAGGNGVGKSTLASKLGATPDFIIDSTLGNLAVAKKQIDAIIANGQKPVIAFVYRTPEQALAGIAERMENGGHAVSPLSFANSHVKSLENLRLLSDEYGGKVEIRIYDSSVAGSPIITLEQLEAKGIPNHADIRKRANEVLGKYGNGQNGGAGSGGAGPGGAKGVSSEIPGQSGPGLDGQGGQGSVRGSGGEVEGVESGESSEGGGNRTDNQDGVREVAAESPAGEEAGDRYRGMKIPELRKEIQKRGITVKKGAKEWNDAEGLRSLLRAADEQTRIEKEREPQPTAAVETDSEGRSKNEEAIERRNRETPIVEIGKNGRKGAVYLDRGAEDPARVEVEYHVVPLESIVASRKQGYLQPRDENINASSDTQVDRIASRLNFDQASESPNAQTGAPLVTPGGEVWGGNGRAMAIRRAYERGTAGDYEKSLRQWAKDNGIDAAGIERPVLVRVTTDKGRLSWRDLANLSNAVQGNVQKASESAFSDARTLMETDGLLPRYARGQSDITANAFLTPAWAQKFARAIGFNGEVAANGEITPDFSNRIRRAFLVALLNSKGENDDMWRTISALVEDDGEGVKNAVNSLVANAPGLLGIAKNPNYESANILPQIADALIALKQLREGETSVAQWKTESRMFNDGSKNAQDYRETNEVVRMLIEWFAGPERRNASGAVVGNSPTSLADNTLFLRTYIESLQDRDTGNLFDGMGNEFAAFSDQGRIEVLRTVMGRIKDTWRETRSKAFADGHVKWLDAIIQGNLAQDDLFSAMNRRPQKPSALQGGAESGMVPGEERNHETSVRQDHRQGPGLGPRGEKPLDRDEGHESRDGAASVGDAQAEGVSVRGGAGSPGEGATADAGGDGGGGSVGNRPPRGGGGRASQSRGDGRGSDAEPGADVDVEPGDGGLGGGRRTGGPAGQSGEEEGGSPVAGGAQEKTSRRDRNASNHVIADLDYLEGGGAKAKYRDNVTALRILKSLKEEGREATPEEREAIAKYVGWGRSEFANGLFGYGYYGSEGAKWAAEREELKKLLTPEEFESARRSSLTAFWTHPRVATKMWDILARMGFKGGRVHEPAVGTGIFFGTMPTGIRDHSVLSGGDKDELAYLIASNLYPGASITRGEFQDERLPDDFYDAVVSNFPFADFTIRRDKYNTVNANLHDYFFLKSLGIVRPGGIVAAITSTGTMDKGNRAARMAIADKADVVACFRLPSGAFKKVAGTDVATDMVILRKREPGEAMSEETAAWIETVAIRDAQNLPGYGKLGFYDKDNPINRYYTMHPDHILGELALGGQFEKITVKPGKTGTMDLLDRAAESVPAGIYKTRAEEERDRPARKTTAAELGLDPTALRDGSIVAGKGDALYVKNGVAMEELKVPRQQVRKAGMLIKLRDALNSLRSAELSDKPKAEIEGLRKTLNKSYDAFVKEFGPLSKNGMLGVMAQDPSAHMLLSLERDYDRKKNTARKSDIFTMRVGYPRTGVVRAENYEQAAGFSSSETGHLDARRVAEMMHVDESTAERELLSRGLAFRDTDGMLVGADEYLSGNVRQKLARAEAAEQTDPSFHANAEALRKVLPKDKRADEITANLGAPWIPTDVMEEFIAHVLGQEGAAPGDRISCSYNSVAGRWTLELPTGWARQALERNSKFTTDFATADRGFTAIMGAALSDEQIKITYRDREGQTHIDEGQTAAANQKVEALRNAFAEWVFRDAKRRDRLVGLYNDRFNSHVARKASGRWLRFDGLTPSITPRSHQAAAVEKMLACHRLLLAHEVGTGKTITYGLMALKAKQTGMAQKPLLVVKNNTLAQVAAEIQRAFPNMNILVGGENMGAARRKATMAQIANNNWDLIIISHDNLDALDVDPHAETEWIETQIRELLAAAESIPRNSREGERVRKGLRKRVEALRERAAQLVRSKRTDGVATFQELGFDMLMVDECQAFKKLPISTYRTRVKGIPTGGSQRAAKLQMNIDYMVAKNPNACVVLGSGTPIDNSMVELYVWQRLLQNDVMREAGIESFDAWAAAFGNTTTDLEMSASGGEWHEVSRFKQFVNLSELYGMMARNMDVVFADKTGEISRPDRKDRVDEVSTTDDDREIQSELTKRAQAIRGVRATKGGDNMLVICGDGRKAAVHPALYAAKYVGAKDTKAHRCVATVADNHRKDPKAAQMIFCDCGVNKTEWGFSLYDFLVEELVKSGFRREQIGVFSASTTPKARKEMAEKMNNGQILVGIGSTDTMGTGINAQRRLRWLHHLDGSRTMTPGSIEQRNGRGHRQGNEYKEVEVVTYLKPGSLDAFTWTLIKNKSGFIRSFLAKGGSMSSIEEESETVTPEMMEAFASGDERVLRLAKVNAALQKLERKRLGFENSRQDTKSELSRAERNIEYLEKRIPQVERAAAIAEESAGKPFSATVGKATFDKRDERLSAALDKTVISAADRLKDAKKDISDFFSESGDLSHYFDKTEPVAQYRGFDIRVLWTDNKKLRYLLFDGKTHVANLSPNFDPSDEKTGMLAVFRSTDAVIPGLKKKIEPMKRSLDSFRTSRDNLQKQMEETFSGGEDITRLQLERQSLLESLAPKKEEKGQGEGGEAEPGTTAFQLPSRDWSGAKIPEMRRELARRGLNVQGNAAMLRARLEGDDDRRRRAGGGTMFQKATPAEAARLDREPTVRVYRAMQLVDGKLYPPMAAKVNGKWVEPTELGTWYVADEHPEVAFEVKGKWYVQLDKGNGRKLSKVAYNPYFHTSRTPLNDQFSSASERPELVMVECEVPESELTSDYHAEKAKDSVGEKDWHSGPVAGWLAEKGHRRKVILSRYAKVVRVVRDSEVAEEVQRMLDGTGISIPEGVVTPALRAELERLGVDISRQTRSAYSWEKIAGTKKNPRTMEIPQFKRGAFAENATQRDMLKVARKSVSDAGGRETASGLVLDIPAFGEVVVVGRSGIVHGLRPYLHYGLVVHKDNADILPVLGKVLSNAIPVNEVRARGDDPKGTTGSTLLLSAAHDEAGEIVPIVVVVNHIRHEKEGLPEIRVYPLKSVNAKNPPSRRGLPPSLTSVGFSKINVGELVGQIKDEVPIFSQDVYGHFKQERPDGDFGSMMFQKTSPGEEWNGARVEQQKRRNGRVAWNVVKKDGTVLERGLRSEEAAKEALARGASRLDLLEEEVAKLKKKDAAAIAEARRSLVEALAKKDATAEERVAAFRELARKAGIHEALAEKEWKLAEKILSQDTMEGVEEAAEKAERAVATVLARASIREYQRDIKELGKEGGGVLRENGMRVNELSEVREAMKAIRADAAPEAVTEKVNELLDQEQALLDRVTSGMDADGVALSDAQKERAVAAYVDTVTKRQIAQNFLGLLKNHGGNHRERLLDDLAAWRLARETMEKLSRDAKSALAAELQKATDRAKAIRQELIQDFTGGRGVPKAMQRKAFENTMTLREKAVRWWRGIVAYHMSGGREWGEFLTQGPGEYRETAAGRLLHDGLAVAQKREMEANEADQERALRLLSGQFHIDPGKGFKELIDLSEICGKLFSDTIGTDANGRPEVTLRSAIYDKRKFGGKRREVLGYHESVCKLKLGELMSIYLYGKQAEALAGVGSGGFTDTPAHSEWADTSLMESLAMHGYSAETMAEIRRALEARGLDRLALAISADMETKSDALDGVMQKHFHSHLVRIPFYAPLRRVHYGADERFDAKASVGGFMGLARSFLKERVTNNRDIQPSNLIDLWQNHNRQANHLITHSDWTAEVGRVFRHTQMQEALEWTVGGKARKYLNSWLDLQASGGQYRRIESPALDAIARRFASAVTINPRVALKQLTSGTMALSMLPPEASTVQWAKDMAYIAIPGNALKFHKMLMAESAEWRQRGSNASDAQMLVNRHVAGSKASLRNMKINRALSIMTRFGDRGGALMGCYGVYMAWKRKFEGEGMGEREAHEAALERFIDAVNAGQQSSLPEYMSFAQQTAGRGFRFLYMFKTAQAAMTKNFFLHADALAKHRGPPKQHIRGMLGIYLADVLFKMMGMAMMPLLFMVGLGGGDGDDEKRKRKDKAEWRAEKAALQSLVDAPFSGLFIAGDIASAVTDHFLSKAGHAAGKENSPRMFDVAEKLLPSFDVWNDAVMGVDKLTAGDIHAAAKFAIDAASKFAGAPYASLAWDYLTDDLPDATGAEDLSTAERIARGLTFSRSAIGAPKKKAQ